MKQLKHIALILTASLALAGCQEEIDLELNEGETRILIVDAHLRDIPQKQSIRLTESISYYSEEKPAPASGAQVTLSGPNGTTLLNESPKPDSAGHYYLRANYPFQVGTEYTLDINYEGENYSTTSTLTENPRIDSIRIIYDDIQFIFSSEFNQIEPEDTAYNIEFTISGLNQYGDYYLFNYYVNGELGSVEAMNKGYIEREGTQNTATGSLLQFTKANATYGDTVTAEMLSISEELYDFYFVAVNQTSLSGNPFAGAPPANVPTNISNGARGNFQVSSVTYATKIFTRPKEIPGDN